MKHLVLGVALLLGAQGARAQTRIVVSSPHRENKTIATGLTVPEKNLPSVITIFSRAVIFRDTLTTDTLRIVRIDVKKSQSFYYLDNTGHFMLDTKNSRLEFFDPLRGRQLNFLNAKIEPRF